MIASQDLPGTFSAAVLRSPHHLEVTEIPMWPLATYGDPDMVLIKVAACGVCGSDFRYFAGENPWAQHTLGRFVPNAPNIVLGHEYAGTVVAVLSEKNRQLLGKRVAPICSKVCGACEDCRTGRSRLCEATIHMGHGQGWGERTFYPGAYAPFAPAWGSSCYEIAKHVSFQEAAMMDILAVCVHVAEQGNIQLGRPVLAIGAGPAGNGLAQVAVTMGASHVVLLDRSSVAIEVARKQGVGTAIHTEGMSDREVQALLKRIAPQGFGSVFDTVGTHASLHVGISQMGKASTLVNLAVHDEEIPISFLRLGSERKITTSCNFEIGDYAKALALLEAGRLRVKEWMTPTTLADLPLQFERVASGKEKSVFKLVVDPWAN